MDVGQATVTQLAPTELSSPMAGVLDPLSMPQQILKGRKAGSPSVGTRISNITADEKVASVPYDGIAAAGKPEISADALDLGDITRFWNQDDPILEFLVSNSAS